MIELPARSGHRAGVDFVGGRSERAVACELRGLCFSPRHRGVAVAVRVLHRSAQPTVALVVVSSRCRLRRRRC
jgi:hypothetical protein